MEKIVRIKKSLIILITILLILIIILLIPLLNDNIINIYKAGYNTRDYYKYPCLSKGEVCSVDDINRAIKVRLPVNKSQAYDFYLLANDEETATFIMDKNLVKASDWYQMSDNRRGPITALIALSKATNSWDNIPLISSYEYEDEGYAYYKEYCIDNPQSKKEDTYDCGNIEETTRGYKSLKIEDGIPTLYFNVIDNPGLEYVKDIKITDYPLRARMIESNEIKWILSNTYSYPDWLIDNLSTQEGYWTMSSSTLPSYYYSQAAFAVLNYKNNVQIEDIPTVNNENDVYKKVGIRPVITIRKEDLANISNLNMEQ